MSLKLRSPILPFDDHLIKLIKISLKISELLEEKLNNYRIVLCIEVKGIRFIYNVSYNAVLYHKMLNTRDTRCRIGWSFLLLYIVFH
jgi:hypothetical protein